MVVRSTPKRVNRVRALAIQEHSVVFLAKTLLFHSASL